MLYSQTALGGAFKVSPVLHSACTLQVRQRPSRVRVQNRAFVCGAYMQKLCKTCGAGFTFILPWQSYCGSKCRNSSPTKKERTRAYQKKRKELLNKIKTDRGCARCGFNAHPAALEFNHIYGEKLFCVSQDAKKAWATLMAEIAKCEVLCSNCHHIHTYEQRHWRIKRKDVVHV